jgi:hypothetical protein
VTFGLTRAGASCASSGLSACAAGCDIVLAMPSTGMVPPVVFRARSTPRDRRYMAQVAEVEVAKSGAVRVRRVVCAVDCGTVVHFRHHGSSLRRDQHQKRPRRANKLRYLPDPARLLPSRSTSSRTPSRPVDASPGNQLQQEMPSDWLSKLDALEGDQLLRARRKRLTPRTRRHKLD